MPDSTFDYETAFLLLSLVLVLVALLLPVPEPHRDETPTDDITHTRRLR